MIKPKGHLCFIFLECIKNVAYILMNEEISVFQKLWVSENLCL